jgi:hypothetical protein
MESILHLITKNCTKYIEELRLCSKGDLLFRGFKEPIDTYREFNHNLDNRSPVNTPKNIHNLINSIFDSQFGWKIRNGVFCYGANILTSQPIDLGYGKQYLFFPIGEFDFVYSPQHFDIYQFVSTVSPTEDTIKNIAFSNDSLQNAINSGEKEDALSNEISVKSDHYYLINLNMKDVIIDCIWGV